MKLKNTVVLGLLISLAVHGTALGALFTKDPAVQKEKIKKPSVRVSLRRPKPPPPPPPPPEPPPKPVPEVVEEKPKPKPKPKPKKKKKALRAKKVKKLSPKKAEPPPTEKPPPPKPAPRKFAVNLQATISTGGIAVPTMEGGSSLVADASNPGAKKIPDDEADAAAKDRVVPAEVTEVTSMPKILRKPTPEELQKSYPDEARRLGLEGDVKLELLVSEKGRVVRTRILKKAGNGFDEAARKLVKLFRFRPAKQGKSAVAVWIPWTYKFRLDL